MILRKTVTSVYFIYLYVSTFFPGAQLDSPNSSHGNLTEHTAIRAYWNLNQKSNLGESHIPHWQKVPKMNIVRTNAVAHIKSGTLGLKARSHFHQPRQKSNTLSLKQSCVSNALSRD